MSNLHPGPLNILQQPKAKMITNPLIQPPTGAQSPPQPHSFSLTFAIYILLVLVVFLAAYSLLSRIHT